MTDLGAWILGISLGVIIMSTIWLSFQARTMRSDRIKMQVMEQHMKEMLDDITAAQMRHHHE
jgi:hypothetical protein